MSFSGPTSDSDPESPYLSPVQIYPEASMQSPDSLAYVTSTPVSNRNAPQRMDSRSQDVDSTPIYNHTAAADRAVIPPPPGWRKGSQTLRPAGRGGSQTLKRNNSLDNLINANGMEEADLGQGTYRPGHVNRVLNGVDSSERNDVDGYIAVLEDTIEMEESEPISADRVELPAAGSARKKQKKVKNYSVIIDSGKVLYGVDDHPAWYMCILMGFQHYIIMFGATVTSVLLIVQHLCITPYDGDAVPQLIGTTFFCCGIATLLQGIFGVRLPIIQGGSFTYIAPILSILQSKQWSCDNTDDPTLTTESPLSQNYFLDPHNTTLSGPRPWELRLCEIQGAIMVASVVEIVIGFSGGLGFILQYISPLVIAPTIALIGLDLFDVATVWASKQYWFALLTVLLIAMFSQYTRNLKLPICHYSKTQGKCVQSTLPLFLMLPVALAMGLVWALYAVLVYYDLIEDVTAMQESNLTRHLKLGSLEMAPWFDVPYPGKHGWPTFSVTSIVGVLAAVLASTVESIGDYYACARMSGVRPPPLHAVNRGIGMEGIATCLFGAFGCVTGTTSYSENIGSIGITKVSSRRVIQCAAIIMIMFGMFTKLSALFVRIPEPIVGGIFIVMFGMVTGVGISNLQFVDLNSSRNLFIIGFSFFFGIQIPKFVKSEEGVIKTGNENVDLALKMLLGTSMLVGGLAAFVLDNTIPGAIRERGLCLWKKHKKQLSVNDGEIPYNVYDLAFLTKRIKDRKWARFVPFLPTFDEGLLKIRNPVKKRRRPTDRS